MNQAKARRMRNGFAFVRSKKGAAALVFAALLCLVLVRVVAVNAAALRTKTEQYPMGQWVPLEGNFTFSAEEKTDGYSVRVTDARQYTYAAYMEKCGLPQNYLSEDAQTSVIELAVQIKNQHNQDGMLAISWFSLKDRTMAVYNYFDGFYAGLQNKTLADVYGVTVRPGTEFTVYLPFPMRYGAQNQSLLDAGGQDTFYFTVSKYPVEKSIRVVLAPRAGRSAGW
ncbi:MAG: hypothetical protein PHG73_04725 [Pygmaiobacter sp.]|nr:hypothetical protein [Pygmaiobacter sp.]